jgi:hypothetical protein
MLVAAGDDALSFAIADTDVDRHWDERLVRWPDQPTGRHLWRTLPTPVTAPEFFEFLKFPTNPGLGGRRDPQSVDEGEKLAADPHHRAFVVYLDTYHLISNGAYRMRQPVIDFLERTIGPTDYFAATTPELPATAITFAQQTDTIDHVITNYWPKVFQGNLGTIPLSKQEDWLQHCYVGRWLEITREHDLVAELFGRWRTDLVLTSLTALTTKLATIREERTNVLLFSDGWSLPGSDNSLQQSLWSRSTRGGPADANACDNELRRLSDLDYSAEFRDLREDALRRNVAFFPISPSGMEVYTDNTQPFDAVDQNLLDTLRALATTTGGQAIVQQNELRAPLEQLSEAVDWRSLLDPGDATSSGLLFGEPVQNQVLRLYSR